MKPLKDTEVVLPAAVKLTADVDLGEPIAEVKWFKEWKELYPGDKYKITQLSHSTQLEVKNPQASDIGKYRCVLKNAIGEEESEARLTLLSK